MIRDSAGVTVIGKDGSQARRSAPLRLAPPPCAQPLQAAPPAPRRSPSPLFPLLSERAAGPLRRRHLRVRRRGGAQSPRQPRLARAPAPTPAPPPSRLLSPLISPPRAPPPRRRLERRLLRNVTYYDDVIVTHEDRAYMDAHYDVSEARQDMYFIRTDSADPEKLEMSFNLSMYQPHLAGARSIFQSIFLDEKQNRRLCARPRRFIAPRRPGESRCRVVSPRPPR